MVKARQKQLVVQGFAQRFTQLTKMKDPGLSNVELGKLFAVSSTTVFKWKNAQAMPDMANACLIALRYKVSVDWLLTGKNQASLPENYGELAQIIDALSPENFGRVLEAAKAYRALEREKD